MTSKIYIPIYFSYKIYDNSYNVKLLRMKKKCSNRLTDEIRVAGKFFLETCAMKIISNKKK